MWRGVVVAKFSIFSIGCDFKLRLNDSQSPGVYGYNTGMGRRIITLVLVPDPSDLRYTRTFLGRFFWFAFPIETPFIRYLTPLWDGA